VQVCVNKSLCKRYKIVVAYDGTDYFGWQVQKEVPSVAQTLQDTFFTVFNRSISILGASRTDAGVHAMGQIATFTTDLLISPSKMLQAWTNILSPDITIRSLQEVPLEFNLHASVVCKTYYYHFFLERPLPFIQRYGWFYRYPVDIAKLRRCLTLFVGTHDFRSFCTGTDMGEDTVRQIDAATVEWSPEYNAYRIAIIGPKFMRYMIRRIVGACLEVASRDTLTEDDIIRLLHAKNPEHTMPNAPAKGLMLHTILLKDDME
jgi:tRNA pseudouridine38-40 synthase